MTRARRFPLVALVAVTLGVSGATAAAAAPSDPNPPASTAPDSTAPESTAPESTTAEPVDEARSRWLESVEEADPDSFAGGASAAELVEGNRVIMIGDSIMASTSSRYGGESCAELVPLGWAVEVDAETGRFVDFGTRVLDRRLDDGFDVGVVMLGNNYGADPVVFEDYLRDIVEELAPRPTILYTVSMYRPDRAEVNDVVFELAAEYDNVRVIDWATETDEFPGLLGGDGLHLSDAGRARFAELLADELGPGPFGAGEDEGDCLRSSYTDDSATAPGATTLPGQAPSPPPQPTQPSTVAPTTSVTIQPPPVETVPPPVDTVPPPVDTVPPPPDPEPTTPATTPAPTAPPATPAPTVATTAAPTTAAPAPNP